MTYIDSAILNLTERCCRRFQMLTGRTPLHADSLTELLRKQQSGLVVPVRELAPSVYRESLAALIDEQLRREA